jgi:zinc protease
MKEKISLTGLLLFLMLSFKAQQNLPANFHLSKLENGLEVLTIEDPSVPLATIEIAVHNGSYTEDKEFNGLSHLYEHMFFKANKDIPSQEKFLERVNDLGISFNGTTGDERVNYFVTLSNEKLKEGLEFVNSAIRYPLFLEEEMKKENPVVDGEFQRNESNPFFHLNDDMNHKMWGDLYCRKNAIGNHDIILTATPEKMRVIKDKYYYPNNSILVVGGNVKHENVLKMAQEIYGSWQPSDFDPFQKYPIPEFEPLKESSSFVTLNENAQVPVIQIGLHGPDTRKDVKATYAADVFSFILSQQTSKLMIDLIDSGLALNVNVGYQTCKYTGPINIFMVPNPKNVKAAVKKLEENIAQWDDPNYFTDAQLENAKNLLSISEAYNRESTSEFVHTVTYWWCSADIEYYTNYVSNLQSVSREDIQNYVRTYIKGKPSITGILMAPKMQEVLGLKGIEPIKN